MYALYKYMYIGVHVIVNSLHVLCHQDSLEVIYELIISEIYIISFAGGSEILIWYVSGYI